ncbi:MAG: redoxin domain-containing protein, partial [Paracoccaceae bacterium]|nr:redoxin domain-containing protein [Paracoccaceae bacterium]
MAVTPPVCDFGWKAPGFRLAGTDGKIWSLDDIRGPKGTLIMFICNHCPYVLAVLDRLQRDAEALRTQGIGVAAISSNDVVTYPQDDLSNMTRLAAERGFAF